MREVVNMNESMEDQSWSEVEDQSCARQDDVG